jgi:DNA-binding XRE family transcriptional regulator
MNILLNLTSLNSTINALGGLFMEYFGLKLQTLRKKASMSQDNLAELIGVSRQAISKWERSEALPDLYNAKKLAEVFSITLDELMDIEIKSIDKTNPKNNKLSLAFLTVPAVLVGCATIFGLIQWIVNVFV